MLIPLPLKLFCPHHLGPGKHEPLVGNSRTACHISHRMFFINTVTVSECITIKKNIPGNRLAVDGPKEIKRKLIFNLKARAAGRTNKRHPEILRKIPTKTKFHSDIDIGMHIPKGYPDMGYGTISKFMRIDRIKQPFTLKDDCSPQLIIKLVVPSIRPRQITNLMNQFLGVLAK
jgi:hypothetical protein